MGGDSGNNQIFIFLKFFVYVTVDIDILIFLLNNPNLRDILLTFT